MTFTSFLDLAGRGGGGGTLLIVTGTDLGDSFFELPLGEGIRRENLEDILALRLLVLLSVNKASLLPYQHHMSYQW